MTDDDRGPIATLDDRDLRRMVLDQRIRYSYSAPVTDLCQYLKVVPPPIHGAQRRRRWHVAVNGVASSSSHTFQDSFANLTVAVRVPKVETAVEFVVSVEAERDTDLRPHVLAADWRYLGPTALTTADEAITEMALAGCSADAESLCERAHGAIVYEWGITGVHTSASGALAGGRGVCQDYAHIMLAACRRAGLPARYVSGHLRGEGGSHAWVEVLHPDPDHAERWLAEGWDPTHNRRTNERYLTVAVGRDYADIAPFSGTFNGHHVTGTLAVQKRLSS
jgi:transglutaminase-like putative cysteine protease